MFMAAFLACSKQFIEATGKSECEKWLVNEDSKVVLVLTSGDESGDCLFKMISSMVGTIFNIWNSVLLFISG